jgi:hypothetical protein
VGKDSSLVSVAVGQWAHNSGTYSDSDGGVGDSVAISASVGNVTQTGTASGTWDWSYTPPSGSPSSMTVTITAEDSFGASRSTTFTLAVTTDTGPNLVVDKFVPVREDHWDVDTGVDIRRGDKVEVTANGQIWAGVALTGNNGPEGWDSFDADPKLVF